MKMGKNSKSFSRFKKGSRFNLQLQQPHRSNIPQYIYTRSETTIHPLSKKKKKLPMTRLTRTRQMISSQGLPRMTGSIGSLISMQQIPNYRNQYEYLPPRQRYYISHLCTLTEKPSPIYEHLQQTLQCLSCIDDVEKPTDDQIRSKMLNLKKRPQYKFAKTIVFDMDQTLIHCQQSTEKCDFKIRLEINGCPITAGINVRPSAKKVLKRLSKHFQIIVFTASQSNYANKVLNYLDPDDTIISHKLFREHCWQTNLGLHIKDLRIINRPLSDIVLVDNAAYSYYFQMDNGIPIIPFFQNPDDNQLQKLSSLLMSLIRVGDVRAVLRKELRLNKYENFTNPHDLVECIYSDFLKEQCRR